MEARRRRQPRRGPLHGKNICTSPGRQIGTLIDQAASSSAMGRCLCYYAACSSQGIVVAAISYYLQIWVIEKKGPVFLSMSMPLSLVFTMAIASFLLGEDVSLGR